MVENVCSWNRPPTGALATAMAGTALTPEKEVEM
jgi:hypothetical protein